MSKPGLLRDQFNFSATTQVFTGESTVCPGIVTFFLVRDIALYCFRTNNFVLKFTERFKNVVAFKYVFDKVCTGLYFVTFRVAHDHKKSPKG